MVPVTGKIEFKCWVKLRKSSKASEFIAQGNLEPSLVKVKLNTSGKAEDYWGRQPL